MSVFCKLFNHKWLFLPLFEYIPDDTSKSVLGWFQYYTLCQRCGKRKDLYRQADYGVRLHETV